MDKNDKSLKDIGHDFGEEINCNKGLIPGGVSATGCPSGDAPSYLRPAFHSVMISKSTYPGVSVTREIVEIPTYEIGEPNPNPMFLEKRVYQGSSGAVYPYPVVESVADKPTAKRYHAVFLENEFLRIMLLPELGGGSRWRWTRPTTTTSSTTTASSSPRWWGWPAPGSAAGSSSTGRSTTAPALFIRWMSISKSTRMARPPCGAARSIGWSAPRGCTASRCTRTRPTWRSRSGSTTARRCPRPSCGGPTRRCTWTTTTSRFSPPTSPR